MKSKSGRRHLRHKRKSIDGLAAIVAFSLKLDVFSDSLFIFCSRCGNKLKILH